MCGIAGFLGPAAEANRLGRIARQMGDAICHRGPDDRGEWVDADAGVALAHRRLSIVDLSPAGHQPMTSACGRWVIVFNGEIYNHGEIRRALEAAGQAPPWRGHSDTEVLLAAVAAHGLAHALERCVGMFAFALWDCRDRTLVLARDRLGEKPLYYGRVGQYFLFASELEALRRHPAWVADIDRDALCLLLRHNCIPAPHSIYRGIRKLLPGTYLVLRPPGADGEIVAYWRASEHALAGASAPFEGSAGEAVERVEHLIRQSLAGQMMADVPLGAFLSGGVDSSTVVALMQQMSARPVRTFSIGFEVAGYDEAPHAKAIARHLGTDHTELYVTAGDALDVVPRLATLYDEPFADSSQIPTYLVAMLARRHVTVSLSGDGGDELFAGYNRYTIAARLWPALDRVPAAVRRSMARLLTRAGPGTWNRVLEPGVRLLPRRYRIALPGDRLHKAADVVGLDSLDALYRGLVSHWPAPERVVIGGREPETLLTRPGACADIHDPIRRMMLLDALTYLPDDILVKVDRASMAVSLESRVPFLDHRLVEFSMRLPLAILHRDGRSKWPLRAILDRYVPRALIDRPKMGFGVPIADWLRGPLREWAESLLAQSRLQREGYFEPAEVRAAWADHLSGRRNLQYRLWDILMFQAWLEATTAPAPVAEHAL